LSNRVLFGITIKLMIGESEERLRAIIQTADSAILVLSPEHNILEFNDKAERLYGMGREEVLNRDFFELLMPRKIWEKASADIEKVLSGERTRSFESVVETKYDGTRLLVWSISRLLDATGQSAGVVVIGQDITEIRQAEKKLEKSYETQTILNSLLTVSLTNIPLSEQLRQSLDIIMSAPFVPLEQKGGIYLADREGGELVMMASKNLPEPILKMCGVVPFGDCLCGRAAMEGKILFASEVDQRHQRRYKNMEQHGHYVVPIVSKAREGKVLGVIFLYVLSGHIRDPHEEEFLQAVANTLVKVIEHKQSQDELEQSESRYRTLAESAPDFIFLIDRSGRIKYINSAASSAFNRRPEELIGKNLDELSPSPLAEKLNRDIETTFNFKTPLQFEEFIELQDRGTWLDTRLVPLGTEFGDGLIMGISRDITERKRANTELLRAHSELEDRVEARTRDLKEANAHLKKEITERKQAESNLRLFAQAVAEAPDGFNITDLEGRIIYSNKKLREMTGFSAREMQGKHLDDLNAEPDYPNRVILPFVRSYGEWEGDMTIKNKAGWNRSWWFKASLVKDGNGRPTGIISISRDITERKKTQALSDTLNEINSAITSVLDFDQVAQTTLEKAAEAIDCDSGALIMREDGRWVIKHVYNLPQEKIGLAFSDEEAKHLVLAAETNKPLVIRDSLDEEKVDREFSKILGVRSLLASPLTVGDETEGVLSFYSRSEPVPFTKIEVDFAEKLASSVSLALKNLEIFATQFDIAETLQESLLQVPNRIGRFDIGHLYASPTLEKAKVGGDFYDVFEIGGNKIVAVIGDVSGKGLHAATFTSLIKNTIKAYANEEVSPSEILSRANRIMVMHIPEQELVTVFLGILDIGSGTMTYCNAGHPPPLIKKFGAGVKTTVIDGSAIGIQSEIQFTDHQEALETGDMLLCYTDGVIEARRNKELFGQKRLVKFIKDLPTRDTANIPELLYQDVRDFSRNKLTDDIAILTLTKRF
jgi:PAS domain S-box-containing protein